MELPSASERVIDIVVTIKCENCDVEYKHTTNSNGIETDSWECDDCGRHGYVAVSSKCPHCGKYQTHNLMGG